MKKKLHALILSLGLAGLVLAPGLASAADVLSPVCRNNPSATACVSNSDQPTSGNSIYGPNGILTRVASLVAMAVGIASVVMIIIGGLKYVTSSGDPSNLKSAKDTILFAVVGLLVALVAQTLVVYVLRRL